MKLPLCVDPANAVLCLLEACTAQHYHLSKVPSSQPFEDKESVALLKSMSVSDALEAVEDYLDLVESQVLDSHGNTIPASPCNVGLKLSSIGDENQKPSITTNTAIVPPTFKIDEGKTRILIAAIKLPPQGEVLPHPVPASITPRESACVNVVTAMDAASSTPLPQHEVLSQPVINTDLPNHIACDNAPTITETVISNLPPQGEASSLPVNDFVVVTMPNNEITSWKPPVFGGGTADNTICGEKSPVTIVDKRFIIVKRSLGVNYDTDYTGGWREYLSEFGLWLTSLRTGGNTLHVPGLFNHIKAHDERIVDRNLFGRFVSYVIGTGGGKQYYRDRQRELLDITTGLYQDSITVEIFSGLLDALLDTVGILCVANNLTGDMNSWNYHSL